MTTATSPDAIGLVDGSLESTSRRIFVVLAEDAAVQLDDLIAIPTDLPDGQTVTHFGIVTELFSRLEGADLPSDTARVANNILPAEHVRRAEVTLLRVHPERFVSPNAGAPVLRATGENRKLALFEDQMKERLPIGLDLGGQPVYADMRFIDGKAGGHVSISGVSGVATKTSYALFLLYQLLETETGIDLFGSLTERNRTRALVFNTKGEDLMHIDRANSRWAEHENAAGQWANLGVDDPQPFKSVRLYAPKLATSGGSVVPDIKSRNTAEVNAYGWTPELFIRAQLLQFCFTAEDQRNTQVGLVEQHVRFELLRRMRRLQDDRTGAVVILDQPPVGDTRNPDSLAAREPKESPGSAGTIIRSFEDLIDLLTAVADQDEEMQQEWLGRAAPGTRGAFIRRLTRMRRHIGQLVSCGIAPVDLENERIHVVDISRLHDDAQRFVVGALLDSVWAAKQGVGRVPLRYVVLDELNKFAPAVGFSPLKELLIDIAERGRSLGVLLIGAQQAASAVNPALPRNAALKVAGRLDAGESDAYRFLSPALRERATRFMPGTMVVAQPIVPEPVPIRFPWPPYATNPEEASDPGTARAAESIIAIASTVGGAQEEMPF